MSDDNSTHEAVSRYRLIPFYLAYVSLNLILINVVIFGNQQKYICLIFYVMRYNAKINRLH